jgi:hypothetical protein
MSVRPIRFSVRELTLSRNRGDRQSGARKGGQVPAGSDRRYAEIYSGRPNKPAQDTAMAMFSDQGAPTGDSAKTFLMQHLHEVAIDTATGFLPERTTISLKSVAARR